MLDYILQAIKGGDIKTVLKWINANRTEDRANAEASSEMYSTPALSIACVTGHSTLVTLLIQLGADVDTRSSAGNTTLFSLLFGDVAFADGDVNERARLLLSWGAIFFQKSSSSKDFCISAARKHGNHDLANLFGSELGGRRCDIIKLSSRPELNGKTCVADEYLPDSNQYKVTLETKTQEVLLIGPDNLKRRDRTPQDCGYYIEFKNGRTTRHDFDPSEECQAFVAALSRDVTQPVVTKEAEARAEQAAAELLAELGLDDPPKNVPTGCDQVKKSRKKKKKGGKDNKK